MRISDLMIYLYIFLVHYLFLAGSGWEEREWLQDQSHMREILEKASQSALSQGHIDYTQLHELCGDPGEIL